jgi:hypothetical protein
VIRGFGARASRSDVVAATVSGYHVAFVAAAVMLAAGAAGLLAFLRRRHLDGLELDASAVPVAA